MDARDNIYKGCDRAIQSMNRLLVKKFGELKLVKWDEVNVIRTVMTTYRSTALTARRKYYEVAFEAYVIGLMMCDVDYRKAHRMAEKAIDDEWVDDMLSRTDFVTLYRFDTETERKAYRLAEAMEEAENRNEEIDRAMRLWSRQIGQYAINAVDYAVVQAFEDAGVRMVEWISQKDGKVCGECHGLDGRRFKVDEVPRKHYGCRCYLVPVED